MKPIESEFTYDQFQFKLIKRRGMVAIFEKSKYYKELDRTKTGFEVVVLQAFPAETLPSGKSYPEREVMPKSEDWGSYGWSAVTREDAEKKFSEWVDREEKSGR